MEDVIIYEIDKNRSFPDVILAKSALWLEDQWLLREGVMHRYDESGRLTQEIEFSEMVIDMKEELKEFFTEQKNSGRDAYSRAKATNQYFERGGSQY